VAAGARAALPDEGPAKAAIAKISAATAPVWRLMLRIVATCSLDAPALWAIPTRPKPRAPTAARRTLGQMQRILCWVCLAVADERAKGWRAFRFDEEPETVILFCCPRCAGHELRRF